MLRLEGVTAGAKILGISGPTAIEVVRAEWIGSDALNVVYRRADGPAEIVLLLAHAIGNAAEQAYRRSDALEKRRALMDAWATYCEPSSADEKVTLLRRKA
jgi:hypothetical protein